MISNFIPKTGLLYVVLIVHFPSLLHKPHEPRSILDTLVRDTYIHIIVQADHFFQKSGIHTYILNCFAVDQSLSFSTLTYKTYCRKALFQTDRTVCTNNIWSYLLPVMIVPRNSTARLKYPFLASELSGSTKTRLAVVSR